MSRAPESGIADAFEVRFRLATIRTGVFLTFVVCAAGAAYILGFDDHGHHAAEVALLVAGALGGLTCAVLPWRRIVASRWREPAFMLWSLTDVAIIAALIALDGGVASPFAFVLFVPVVFSSMSYPLPNVLAVAVAVLVTPVAITIAMGGVSVGFVIMLVSMLGCAAAMAAWQARHHDVMLGDLARLSRADPLTGCLNRRGFEERALADLAHARRTRSRLSLVLLDLDRFKEINDTRGHAAGDQVLRQVVAALRSAVRPTDAVGRLGGDEFAVLLADADRDGADQAVERMRSALPETPVSVGIATFPADAADLDGLLKAADTDLYVVKERGREEDRTEDEDERFAWAAALARAADTRAGGAGDHGSHVAELAVGVGRRLGWQGEQLELLRLAALLHDVGKATVPEAILRKPSTLTADEYAAVNVHSTAGAELIERIEGLDDVARWIRHSHEHVDGSGYPNGLAGDEIPLGSRIILVADAYDAMTCTRPYRKALPPAAALAELRRHAGRQFDPHCVEALIAYVESAALDEADAAAA